MDLLLDINISIDLCAPRMEWYGQAKEALERCAATGGRVWLYVGSVQTLHDDLYKEFKLSRPELSNSQCMHLAKHRLADFAEDKHWLAALASEGHVFETEDPGNEQLRLALDRFNPDEIALLTRDESLLARQDPRILSPEQYLAKPPHPKPLDFIDLKTQQGALRPQLEQNIHRVLHRGQYIMGPEVKQLEERLAEYVGVKHCITASSGTDTLLIAMMALGIGPGDEVITTPFTFIATGEMIALLGAKPIFVDIDPRTYNIDPAKVEAAITPKTRAIMPVSLYGQCADLDAINAVADKHGMPVIEDAAQSFGATYKGKKSCALSTIGSTSFFPSKPLGGYGDGGALFTNDNALAKAMREIRVHGQDRRYHHPIIGINGRMDTLQAAILLAKLDRFIDWEVQRRHQLGARYTELINSTRPHLGLSDSRGTGLAAESVPVAESLGVRRVTPPYIEPYNTSVYAQYTIQVADREALTKMLNQAGIPTAVHYPIPLHLQPVFANSGFKEGEFPISEASAKRVMSLPIGPDMTPQDQDRVTNALFAAIGCDHLGRASNARHGRGAA